MISKKKSPFLIKLSRLSYIPTFVSSWALARLSTAMAKNTLSSVSVYRFIKEANKVKYPSQCFPCSQAIIYLNNYIHE